MTGNCHVRCRAGENPEISSKDYLSLYLARNYGSVAKRYYGYQVSVIDLRNPTRSDGNNFLTLINRYMDIAEKDPDNIAARAKLRNTPRSSPRPSSTRTAATPITAKTSSSMTPPRACSRR